LSNREPSVPGALLEWGLAQWGQGVAAEYVSCCQVAGDASNRRYYRLSIPGQSRILMHAPPATENNPAFIGVRQLLEDNGLRVPRCDGVDLNRGYLILEDLGDSLLLDQLTVDSVAGLYGDAMRVLQNIAAVPVSHNLASYDKTLLMEEMNRFPQWFVQGLLGCQINPAAKDVFGRLSQALLEAALDQPAVLVHRDFHSRNLMVLPDGKLAMIDFQDAVCGPVTYDLVSLLRDCYIRWPKQQVESWAVDHKQKLIQAGLLAEVTDDDFLRWFDFMGLQRHLKVLGVFARLSLRDGKQRYLEDLPLVVYYLREVLAQWADRDAACADFLLWFDQQLGPLISQQAWMVEQS